VVAAGLLQEGPIALWRGWLPSVIGVIPYVGLNFAVYETLKEVVLQYHGMQLCYIADPWQPC
jgi:solute carrier family 25 phosphate transporter 23/24/25/41